MVSVQLKSVTQIFEGRVSSLRQRMAAIISGKRKNEVCDWWLSLIETRVDSYLSRHGYIPNSIPENYTDERPQSLEPVQHNLKLLEDTLAGRVDDEEFFEFISSTTKEIYEVLDVLKTEMAYLLHEDWSSWVSDVSLSDDVRKKLESDHAYLVEMKAMDEEIFRLKREKGPMSEKKRIEMTTVVPISGLLIARLQVYACELTTVLDIWAPKEGV
jgi:hypothetical protein